MAGLTCGIDIGSTNVKVLLLDEEGRTAWVKSVAMKKQSDGLGPVTDAMQLLDVLEALVIEGWRAAGKGRPLAAIASSGIGEDGVGVDQNLKPMGLALSWFDKRGEQDSADVGLLPAARDHPAIRFDFCMTAGKWRWLNRERPSDLGGAGHWITITDFPAVRWSGIPFISETLAPRTGCFDVYGRDWIPELLLASGAPPLPPLRRAGDIVGTMRPNALTAAGAASARTLLVAAGHDHPMAASAIRRLHRDARVNSLGTANATYGEAMFPAASITASGVDLSVPAAGGPGVACIGPIEFTVALREAVKDDAVLRDLLAAPEIAGAPSGKLPSTLFTGNAARLRAALEETAFRARQHFDAMTRAGVPIAPIYATGGWAQSRALVELRASMFGEAITVIGEPELTATGAALFAAEAAHGKAPDFARHHRLEITEPRRDWMEVYAGWNSDWLLLRAASAGG